MNMIYPGLVRILIGLMPRRFRYRLANLLYPFNSNLQHGAEVIVKYYKPEFGLKFLLNTREYIGWNIFFLGEYEPETNAVLETYLRPGMCVLEAGANHGSESVIIGRLVGKDGRLFAFEPYPPLADLLDINLKINNLENVVKVERTALGDEKRFIDFYITDEKASNQGMSSKYKFDAAQNRISVEQITLDEWISQNEIQHIDFIKMDIQGAEFDMLSGATKCLKEMHPVLYLEADEVQARNGEVTFSELYRFIKDMGYEIKGYRNGRWTPLHEAGLVPGNWLALPVTKERTK